MEYENPADMLGRLKLGREESCQRMLTTLILGGTYPRWNTRSRPTADGVRFLRLLDELSFGEATPPDAEVFVDELELRPRVESERGGAPDWAVLWPERLWLIELKTEKGSHRREQLPYYFELGAHHFPAMPVDITYLTGPMTKPAPTVSDGQRYGHLTWQDVLPLVRDVWAGGDDCRITRIVDVLEQLVDGLEQPWPEWKAAYLEAPLSEVVEPAPPADSGLSLLITATAEDGEQRALDEPVPSLEDLQALRLHARELVLKAPAGSPVKHVMPWVWSGTEKSMGQPLTAAGADQGYELRFSRFEKAQYV